MDTPLMEAGLQNKSVNVCLRAIGMGAVVTVHVLNYLMNYHGVDLKGKVETRFGGTCGLAIVIADCANTVARPHIPQTVYSSWQH